MKKVDFFDVSLSRVLLGDNPFNGHSYIKSVHDGDEMMDFYTMDQCLKTLFEAEELGVDGYIALGEPFILRLLRQYRNEGGKMKILFQNYAAMDLDIDLRLMLQCEPIAIYHQGTTADYLVESDKTDELKDRIKMIKDTGVYAGLGTHVPETLLRAEEEEWGADFYMTCLYNARRTQRGEQSGFITGKPKELVFYPDDRFLMFDAIRKVEKTCIAFKVFAGGQIFLGHPEEDAPVIAKNAMKETLMNIKTNDLICIGVFQKYKDQLKENVEIVNRIERSI